jgi:hypothetical protein
MFSVGSKVSFTYATHAMTGEVVGKSKSGRYIILSDNLFKKDGGKKKVMVGEKIIKLLEAVA